MEVKRTQSKQALIIGASSGVGHALAVQLVNEGWNVILTARRLDKLVEIQNSLGTPLSVYEMDINKIKCTQALIQDLWEKHKIIDLVIISAGIGFVNQELDWEFEEKTINTNVVGFAAVAQIVMKLFAKQGHGQLASISSIAKYQGDGDAPAYGASKSFMSAYLDGLRAWAKKQKLPIYVTELCPGFIDTAMMQTDKPFWVATPQKAAKQMLSAIKKKRKHSIISKRWILIAWLLKLLPR